MTKSRRKDGQVEHGFDGLRVHLGIVGRAIIKRFFLQ